MLTTAPPIGMRFEYWQSRDGTWSWQLKTPLGDMLARGTKCTSRENCLAAINLVKLAASAPARDISSFADDLVPERNLMTPPVQ